MKILIIVFVAVACAAAHPPSMDPSMEPFLAKRIEFQQKLSAMTPEERHNEIHRIQLEHLTHFDEAYGKIHAATPEEQRLMIETIKAKLPAPILAKLAALTAEEKLKIRNKIEEFAAMTTEERLVVLAKMHSARRSHIAQSSAV